MPRKPGFDSQQKAAYWMTQLIDLGKNHNQIKDSPVTNISWYAAKAYCKWKGKRLSSIDAWEYAGKARIVNDPRSLGKILLEWYSNPAPKVPPAVGSTFTNELQLYDMHGWFGSVWLTLAVF